MSFKCQNSVEQFLKDEHSIGKECLTLKTNKQFIRIIVICDNQDNISNRLQEGVIRLWRNKSSTSRKKAHFLPNDCH